MRAYDTVQPPNPTIVRPSLDPKRTANGLALTLPTRWNSWNRLGCEIDDKLIRATADVMVSSGMRDAGYVDLILDDCWQEPRDTQGQLTANSGKLPSRMKALGDYIHARVLKFGIYSDAGSMTCGRNPGSQGHEYQDARTFAECGADYLKYDWCYTGTRNSEEANALMADALRATGRDIVFSICDWGVDHLRDSDGSLPWQWDAKIGNLWRTTTDIGNDRQGRTGFLIGVVDIVDRNEPLYAFAGPKRLAEADALHGIAEDRCQGLWKVKGLGEAPLPLFAAADACEQVISPGGTRTRGWSDEWRWSQSPQSHLPARPDSRLAAQWRRGARGCSAHPISRLC